MTNIIYNRDGLFALITANFASTERPSEVQQQSPGLAAVGRLGRTRETVCEILALRKPIGSHGDFAACNTRGSTRARDNDQRSSCERNH